MENSFSGNAEEFRKWVADLERRAAEHEPKPEPFMVNAQPVDRVTVNGFDDFYVPRKENTNGSKV